jgi:hypothetical protein
VPSLHALLPPAVLLLNYCQGPSISTFLPNYRFHLPIFLRHSARLQACLPLKDAIDPSLIKPLLPAPPTCFLLIDTVSVISTVTLLPHPTHPASVQSKYTLLSQLQMRSLSGRQLLTCRYWAFGTRCPDIDASDVQTCQYAHWDTGRLADFYEQRGTCYEWFHKRVCPFGVNCTYEHRDTGVMGLNQGCRSLLVLSRSHFPLTLDLVLVLHGLNLEIADAANRSGFNTRNQVALMDLIWAVRRIAVRHAVERPTVKRPPKHPVYPDRYRPGDPSDNTNRPKKRGREFEGKSTNTGTSDDPINIDIDDLERNEGGTAANSKAKRLKVAAGQIGRHKFELPGGPKSLNPVHPSKLPTTTSKRPRRGRTAASNTTYMPSPRSLDFPAPRPSSVGPIFNSPRPLVVNPRSGTVLELEKVGNTLKDNVEAVVECGRVMKAMYNRDERLCDDLIYKELEYLKGKFDTCLSDTEFGVKTVEKIISLIEDNKDHVMDAVNRNL